MHHYDNCVLSFLSVSFLFVCFYNQTHHIKFITNIFSTFPQFMVVFDRPTKQNSFLQSTSLGARVQEQQFFFLSKANKLVLLHIS